MALGEDSQPTVYSGTAWNLRAFENAGMMFPLAPLNLPLSLVGDTLLLPITIPQQIALNRKEGFIVAGATGDMARARRLIEEHPDYALEHYYGAPLISVAVASGQPEFVALLLEHGADVHAPVLPVGGDRYLLGGKPAGPVGASPLFIAVCPEGLRLPDSLAGLRVSNAAYAEVVRLLMDSGAEAKGWPLEWAVQTGKTDILRLMVERGADIEDVLVQVGTVDVEDARFLIEHGADVNARDDKGWTPLHGTYGDVEVARLLIEHGADVNAHDDEGKTPLGVAIRGDHPEVADLLRAHGGQE
jgi:uncharacterized protein YceK